MSIGGLLDTSRRALNAQSTSIAVVGDNIANVNTLGYTRRRADLVSTTSANSAGFPVGSGVAVKNIVRIADQFLNRDLVARIGDRAKASIKSEFLLRAEGAFSLEGDPGSINYQLNAFFSSLQDLQANPADIPLRTQVLQRGSDLSFSIKETYNSIAQLQREADDRLKILVVDVNRISASIAEVNAQISRAETSSQQALTLRDQRDSLLQQLGQLVSFQTIEDSNAQVGVYLSNGFSLISGANSYELQMTSSPSFAPPGGYPPGLDGRALNSIVHDFGGGSHGDLTHILRAGGGEIAGLLELRGAQRNTDTTAFDANGVLIELATQVELIARDLLTRFNLEYRGPDEDGGTAGHQPSSFDLNGNSPIAFGLFSFSGAAAGNNFGDVDNDGVPSNADLNSLLTSGAIPNFASRLIFNVTDERAFAAARDLNPVAGATTWSTGDSSNIRGLIQQRDVQQTYTLGTVNLQATIDGMYALTVSNVGGKSARALDDQKIFQARENQIKELQQSYSGVLLIKFQRAFQGAAKLIRIGDDLSNELVNLLR
ncbi:MAG TPA: flagellar hook-associated protein FlgK [Oligoflexia bacterium]|nr:flagellar hook-associated protein FlgK [Oligoflexia bacterium]